MSSFTPSTAFHRRHGRGRLADDRGVALVEFALVLPLVLLMLFAILDFGRALSFWNDQTHLANEAARYAAVNGCPGGCGDLKSYIAAQAESGSGTVNIAFCYPLGGGAAVTGNPVHVTVRDNFNWVGHLTIPASGIDWNPAATTIVANSEMRLETNTNTNYASALTAYNLANKTCNPT